MKYGKSLSETGKQEPRLIWQVIIVDEKSGKMHTGMSAPKEYRLVSLVFKGMDVHAFVNRIRNPVFARRHSGI